MAWLTCGIWLAWGHVASIRRMRCRSIRIGWSSSTQPPYTQTALLCGMAWLAPHVLHGAHLVDDAALQAHADALRARLEGYASGALPLQSNTQG